MRFKAPLHKWVNLKIILIQLPLSLLLAVMVGRDLPGRSFFRIVFFMPYVISEVITAIMWLFLLNPNPDRGFINAVVVLMGAEARPWLGDTTLVIPALFIALSWKYFGFHMLLYMAGLQNIPQEIEEAGRIDGANSFQNFFTSPCLCWAALFVLLFISPCLVQSSNLF